MKQKFNILTEAEFEASHFTEQDIKFSTIIIYPPDSYEHGNHIVLHSQDAPLKSYQQLRKQARFIIRTKMKMTIKNAEVTEEFTDAYTVPEFFRTLHINLSGRKLERV